MSYRRLRNEKATEDFRVLRNATEDNGRLWKVTECKRKTTERKATEDFRVLLNAAEGYGLLRKTSEEKRKATECIGKLLNATECKGVQSKARQRRHSVQRNAT